MHHFEREVNVRYTVFLSVCLTWTKAEMLSVYTSKALAQQV